jgi:hypothetical protein
MAAERTLIEGGKDDSQDDQALKVDGNTAPK